MITIRVEGAEELAGKLDPGKVDKPFKAFFEASAIAVQGKATPLAPIDTGRLRASMTYQVKSATLAEIWPDVYYAIYQDQGTSRGIRPKYFMRDGAKAALGQIKSLAKALVKELVRL